MRLIQRLIIWPIVALAIVFAIANRAPVQLNLWPFPYQITVPLFIALLLTLAVGLLIGGLAAWTRGGRWRRRAREDERRIAELERELAIAEASPAQMPRTLSGGVSGRLPATVPPAAREPARAAD